MALNPNIKSALESEARAQADDWSAILKHKSVVATGIYSSSDLRDSIDANGIVQSIDAEWVGVKSDFGTEIPAVRDVVRIDADGNGDVNMFVVSVSDDEATLTIALRKQIDTTTSTANRFIQ